MIKLRNISMFCAMVATAALLPACVAENASEADEATAEVASAIVSTQDEPAVLASVLLNNAWAGPQTLPASAPDSVLQVSQVVNGVTITDNLRAMIARFYDPTSNPDLPTPTPWAQIRGVYRTGAPVAQPNLLVPNAAPPIQSGSPAVQVYQCQAVNGGFAWTFLRPEAGLQAYTPNPLPPQAGLALLIPQLQYSFSHFRYPGDASVSAAGPAWRASTNDGVAQQIFVGALETSVANGAANIPLLRLHRANTQSGAYGQTYTQFPITSTSTPTDPGAYVGYVLRLNTVGGIAPTTGCSAAANVGAIARQPYSADYYFVQARF
jgi:hypothetical protein